ncbi:glutathione peroxidase [Pseudotabrizicola algicola]|uniref:Glutathione peroxidase n=1 Tax=Pseudotabrizicola algicola TaxID=2709381 RepID=A0A6B3RIA3_9RHOB|nr:glutathione peroxidase [Pseudotabrizicola algicola]NEX45784.1 glutathione peroxidase [Pseudotabrizicola algicola]
MQRRVFLAGIGSALVLLAARAPAFASAPSFAFDSIDGGLISLDDWRGRPVLVVNTASLCGFAGQFDDLQALHERYGPRGLLVLAVPSDDFNQELADAQAVKEYCALRFDLTLAMTDITHVRGPDVHPFYRWLAAEQGFTPGWNFNKVLIGPAGEVVGTWGSAVKPTSAQITRQIETLLR